MCTFTASSTPAQSITVNYEVETTGGRGWEYSQHINMSARSATDSVYYLPGATSITVTLAAGTGYTLGSPSEASITVGSPSTPSTVGLHVNESEAFDGYTVLTSAYHNRFYLIDNDGLVAYRWDRGGGLGRLLDNGNLLTGDDFVPAAEIKPDGTDAWTYGGQHQHHEILKLSNGNYMYLVSAFYSRAESIAAGANPSCLGSEGLEVDKIVEVTPTGTSGGTVVWEWNLWDHLIQDYDSTKANYGVVSDHPELIDINFGLCRVHHARNGYIKNPHHLTHLNAIDYHPTLNQILITSRHFSEIWVIDRSTTTAQAAGHTGGDSGMGGDLMYRYGNPRAYKNGAKADQRLFFPHDAQWIPAGLPGAGNVLIYNNGHEHPGFLRTYASTDELVLPAATDRYLRAGGAYMPATMVWTHKLPQSTWVMSGVQRLPNGNTLITEGSHGRISEVTSEGKVVWHYVSPLARETNVLDLGGSPDSAADVWIYRIYKYPTNHPGVAALTLIPEADRAPVWQAPESACSVTATADDLVDLVRSYHDANKTRADYNSNWWRVLIAFGAETSDTLTPFTAAEAETQEQIWDGWQPIREELERLEGESAKCASPSDPSVTITGGGGVTEGTAATFTLTATPTPSADITVNVNLTSVGGFATAGSHTVTISSTGTATLTVPTIGDSVVENDGSVTATVASGSGYTIGSPSAATVTVSDDDSPPLPTVTITKGSNVTEGNPATFTVSATGSATVTVKLTVTTSGNFGVTAGSHNVSVTNGTGTLTLSTTDDSTDEDHGSVTATVASGSGYAIGSPSGATVTVSDDDDPLPEISITGGSDITEGGNATFTLTATPKPKADLSVKVTVAAQGNYGVATGTKTVTIGAGGTATLTVSTTGDQVHETDGSVTATLAKGAGYTVSSTAGSARVGVSDDDPLPVGDFTLSIQDASATEGGEVVFSVTLSKAATHEVRVNWQSEYHAGGRIAAVPTLEFWLMSGTLVFQPGETTKSAEVFLNQDEGNEGKETFVVKLSSPQGATITRAEGVMTIIDDD